MHSLDSFADFGTTYWHLFACLLGFPDYLGFAACSELLKVLFLAL